MIIEYLVNSSVFECEMSFVFDLANQNVCDVNKQYCKSETEHG